MTPQSSTEDDKWFTSSRSNNQQQCVEVRISAGTTEVRDSKDRGGPTLSVGPAGWASFTAAVKLP